MRELFFVLSIVIALGLMTYLSLQLFIEKNEEKNDSTELDELRMLIESVQIAGIGTKITMIFMLGGTTLSSMAVSLINLPAEIMKTIMKK